MRSTTTPNRIRKPARKLLVTPGEISTLPQDALRLLARIHQQRTDLAREAHTHLGQKLTALNIELHVYNSKLAGEGSSVAEGRKAVAKMGGWVEELVQFSKTLVAQLTPNVLMQTGFDAAAAWAIRMSDTRTGNKTLFTPAGVELNLDPLFAAYAFNLFADALHDLESHILSEVRLSAGKSSDRMVAEFGVRRLPRNYAPAAAVRCRTVLIGGSVARLSRNRLSWIELEMPVLDLQAL